MKKLLSVQKVPAPSRLLCGLATIMLLLAVSCQKDNPDPVPVTRSLQVWLHRVNTPGKAQYFQDSYRGFELDVHYDTNIKTFIVKHNFTDTSTLTLPVWLTSISSPEKLGYWLDFKNLTLENGSEAFRELLRIRHEFNLTKNLIVVESDIPAALLPFDTLNFRISFYIPWFNPAGPTSEEEEAWADYIQENVAVTGIKTISGYYFQHDLMQQWFPKMNKLLWYLDSYDPVVKDSIITVTKEDHTVEVLLVAEDYL